MSLDVNEVERDWQSLPLEGHGRSLIEASAGTGKTWTIAALYLRCVLETDKLPNQLLVTSFTKVAAAEISARVRNVLEGALRRATEPSFELDGISGYLDSRWAREGVRGEDEKKLRIALAGFDLAATGTLHGICQRIIGEHPFAVRAGFTPPEVRAADEIQGEIANDLWRNIVSPSSHSPVRQAWVDGEMSLRRKDFEKRLKAFLSAGAEAWETTETALEWDSIDLEFDSTYILECLTRKKFTKGRKVTTALQRIAAHLAQNGERLHPTRQEATAWVSFDGALKIQSAHENDAEALALYALVERARDVSTSRDQVFDARFWNIALEKALEMREERLAASNAITFDLLLAKVRDALESEAAGGTDRPLADALFDAWPMAMVDEFQDTDEIQFEILNHIYSDAAGNVRGRLIMIGDPKQSIYRFRGADIDAYVHARDMAGSADRMQLARNFRSRSRMVSAINALYAATDTRMGTEDQRIHYVDVESGRKEDAPVLTFEGDEDPVALHLWCPPEDNESNLDPIASCASLIVEWLGDAQHTIGDRRIEPGDIAVLLTSNDDVQKLLRELQERGVPSVGTSDVSVFQSDIAMALETVLYAIANASDPTALHAALSTALFGDPWNELTSVEARQARTSALAPRFAAWHSAWLKAGPLPIVLELASQCGVRFLSTRTGERNLTDLRHLGELLQSQWSLQPEMSSLLAWFAGMRRGENSNESDREATAMRMESDEARVRVMTAHASKGLEFGIVFLPTLWRGVPDKDVIFQFVEDGARVASADKQHKAPHREALEIERRRLVYVALTRAIHACHVFGPVKKSDTVLSSMLSLGMARLNSPTALAAGIQVHECWPSNSAASFDSQVWDASARIARTLPEKDTRPLRAWHSFSSLTGGARHHTPLALSPALDEGRAEAAAGHDATGGDGIIATFGQLKGTAVGTALHGIFEHREPGVPVAAQIALVKTQLEAAGVRFTGGGEALAESIAASIDRALAAPLEISTDKRFSLSDLDAKHMRSEMSFHFSIADLNMAALRRVLARHDLGEIMPQRGFDIRGLMNGSIDLVFEHDGRWHVLDYKGNWVGDRDADYEGDALVRYMDHSYYRFQALLYTVALDRYLKTRVPGYERKKHLGHAVYLFVRTARPGSRSGIWADRFDDALIEDLQSLLTHGEGVAA